MLRISEEGHRTDTGRQRHVNEDAFYARAPVYAVADGMGGAQAGEVASRIAASVFDRGLPDDGSPEENLSALVRSANSEIHQRAQQDEETAGMGTTLTAAVVGEAEITLAHVGDSRAYVYRDGELRRLTQDHSLVDALVRQGRLTPEEAENHPQRSIITRALGPEATVQVDTRTFPARSGDVFLLCSDGLTTMLDEGRILQALGGAGTLQKAVDGLVDDANRAGGRDNITIVAFRVEEVDVPGASREQPTGEQATTETNDLPVVEESSAAAPATRSKTPPAESSSATPVPPGRAESAGVRDSLPADPDVSKVRRGLRIVLVLAALAVVLGAAVLAGRQIRFLGTDDAGRVAVYRGLPYELPAGIDLYSKEYASPLQTSSLSPPRRRVVADHKLRSRSDALDLIRDIERAQDTTS